MTKFEDLPNEVIYEIFDYLDISHVFESFFNLNNRFKYLIINCPFVFKIDLSFLSKSTFEHLCKNLIETNKDRIISLRLTNPLTIDLFLSFFSFNENFIQLECVVFTEINFKKLEPILLTFSLLPRLYSLTITNNIEVCDSSEIYRLIFDLSHLKSCTISPKFYGGSLSLNIANRLYADDEFDLDNEYKKNLEKYYQSKLELIDFNQAEQSAQHINKWISNQTNNIRISSRRDNFPSSPGEITQF